MLNLTGPCLVDNLILGGLVPVGPRHIAQAQAPVEILLSELTVNYCLGCSQKFLVVNQLGGELFFGAGAL